MSAEQRFKDSARSYANQHKRRGRLIPQPCEKCGDAGFVVMHHADYRLPVEVTWLCEPCHFREHGVVLRELT